MEYFGQKINDNQAVIVVVVNGDFPNQFRGTCNISLETCEADNTMVGMGLGAAAMKTFGMYSQIDYETQKAIDERRDLDSRKHFGEILTKTQEKRLLGLNLKLDQMGYKLVFRDPLYQKFEMEFAKHKREKGLGLPKTSAEVAELNQLAEGIFDAIIIDWSSL